MSAGRSPAFRRFRSVRPLQRVAPVKRSFPPLVCLLTGCLTGPFDREASPAGESAPPTVLRLHGALSDGIEPRALTWVSARGDGCPPPKEVPTEYAGPATVAIDGLGDVVSRAVRDGTGHYTLEIPWRWSSPRCTYQAASVAIHSTASGRPLDDLGPSVLRIVSHRMSHSTDVTGIGALSCRPDPFMREGLSCRRASGPFEPGSDATTGLTFFSHVDEPDPSRADPSTIDISLDVLERRQSCQLTACELGCAPGEADCLPSDCDPARDCAATVTSFRQDASVAIAARGALVSRSELFVEGEGAAPARLADLVIQLDYFAPGDLVLRVSHGDIVTTVLGPGTQPVPRFGAAGRGEYVIPLDPRAAASPSGLWTLEVEQRRPFFTGAVLSWGLDLYR